jgi:asparagine synthase (glutamine-hydrolysing)
VSGFTAILNTDHVPVDAAILDAMTDAMAFRGPDLRDVWLGDHVGLGHVLLRTTDESARESQPSGLGDGVWIAADARIDGRATLVRRLRERGRSVTAEATDVELLLHAYVAWGDGLLGELIGDFAFVLWDSRRQRLLAARDQLGVAQLFYARADAAVILGNTLESLLCHPGVPATLDDHALADAALFTVFLDEAATAYASIRRLAPGHKLVCDRHGVQIKRYWALPPPARLRYRRPGDYVEHFRTLFDEAVADRLRTDRAGSQLSGGMDSTSITVTAQRWLQAQARPFDLRAYAIEYRSLIPDEEGAIAAEVGRHAGFPVEVLSGESFLDMDPVAHAGRVPPEPGPMSVLQMAEICRRTAEFSRVLLTGYGGDPLLASPVLTRDRMLAALRQGSWRWPARSLRARLRRQPVGALPAWANRRWAEDVGCGERQARFSQLSLIEQTGMVRAPLWRGLFAFSDPGFHGLELRIRFPFFDLRLLEFVRAIPPTPWLENKHLLRAAVGDRLPEIVRIRPKSAMAGDVVLERNRRAGVPSWQIELLDTPEMAGLIDQDWLRRASNQPAAAQAQAWATDRPPVQVAYWLHHRSHQGARAGHVRPTTE